MMSNPSDAPLPESIEKVETHDVIDTTKMNTFQECPREYFFEYILGWRPDKPNLHLEFGSAFHLGLEHMVKNHSGRGMNDPEVVNEAYTLFYDYYRLHFSLEQDDANAPKDPVNCMLAFVAYAEKYAVLDKDIRFLYTEIAGSVPISEENTVHFKMDTIIEDTRTGLFASWDHKTTGKETTYWGDQFRLGLQPGTYSHALYSLYPADKVFGVVMNGIVLRKSGPGFMRIEIRKTLDSMQVYIFNANRIFDQIKWNHRILSESSENDDVLRAFPQNTTACTKWGTCPYLVYCEAWNNPLQHCQHTPPAFKVEHWDPRSKQDTASYIYKEGKLHDARHQGTSIGTEGQIQGESQDKQDARPSARGKGGWENEYFSDVSTTSSDT